MDISFKGYKIVTLSFFDRCLPEAHSKVSVPIKWFYGADLTKVSDTEFSLLLAVITGKEKDNKDPFVIKVAISGDFSFAWGAKEVVEKDALYSTAIAILFPFLRAQVNSLMSLAGYPNVILPIINTMDFYDGTLKAKCDAGK
jgi:preprotein translocase subunit SecB